MQMARERSRNILRSPEVRDPALAQVEGE
jgi:hypothetical protein